VRGLASVTDRELTASEQATLDKLNPIHQPPVRKLLIDQQDILNTLQEDRRSTPTGMVHHYTDRRGLEGITQSGTLRLSDYTSMQDTSEINYGFGIGMDVLRREYEESPKTRRLRRFVEGTERLANSGLGTFFDAYVLSLTLNGDELTQWERFADNAAGYCLGFDGPTLDQAFVEFTRENRLEASGSFEVLYSETQLRSLMKQYVQNALEAVLWLDERFASGADTVRAMHEIGANLLFAFIFTALFFKDPHYHSEREYPFLMMTLPDNRIPSLLTRPGRGGSIGYFAFDWKSRHAHALRNVCIGPAITEVERRPIVDEALSRAGLSPEVVMSAIPPIRL
jgi:hypothetical protein